MGIGGELDRWADFVQAHPMVSAISAGVLICGIFTSVDPLWLQLLLAWAVVVVTMLAIVVTTHRSRSSGYSRQPRTTGSTTAR